MRAKEITDTYQESMFLIWQLGRDKDKEDLRQRSTNHAVDMLYLIKVEKYRGRDTEEGWKKRAQMAVLSLPSAPLKVGLMRPNIKPNVPTDYLHRAQKNDIEAPETAFVTNVACQRTSSEVELTRQSIMSVTNPWKKGGCRKFV
ncbi:hypothetical protein GALMADRAFT_216464 [Galerina marginata CBS 339.88]|uniref:Uncharacterized protein n=1 Tax=Galerina marginata (strain CBS 339.88) TaxID=685588 RepID=A0A067S920_GALM3|nr:hypothetical protein GALMADRAFT_216464 [Galerina marginata CBS 339.88]